MKIGVEDWKGKVWNITEPCKCSVMKGRSEENSGVDWSTVQSIMKMPRPRGGKSLWNGIRGMVGNFRMFIAVEAERRQVCRKQGRYERIQGRKELETQETGDAD